MINNNFLFLYSASTVDWAELAKQWIQMKETAPQEQAQPPQEQSHPSQPVASSGPAPQVHPPEDVVAAGGGGEMDMEIEDDKGPAANGSDQQNGKNTFFSPSLYLLVLEIIPTLKYATYIVYELYYMHKLLVMISYNA